MITVTAIGKVVNPKSTGKTLSFALSCALPMDSKNTQLIGVTVFTDSKTRLGEFLKAGKLISVGGRLEIGEYKGKTTVRIIAGQKDVYLVPTFNRDRNSSRPSSSEVVSEDVLDSGNDNAKKSEASGDKEAEGELW